MRLNSKVMQRFEVRVIDPASPKDSHYLQEYKELRDLQQERDGLRKTFDLPESIYAIVIDKKHHKTVGGARLLIKPENSDDRLPFEDENKVEILFPDIDRNGVCYAGIDGVVVDESLRQDKTGDLLRLELKKTLDAEAGRKGAEFGISTVALRVYFPTLNALKMPALDPLPSIVKMAGKWTQIINKKQGFVSIIKLPTENSLIQHTMNVDMAYTLAPSDHVRDVFRRNSQKANQITLRGRANELAACVLQEKMKDGPTLSGSNRSKSSSASPTHAL